MSETYIFLLVLSRWPATRTSRVGKSKWPVAAGAGSVAKALTKSIHLEPKMDASIYTIAAVNSFAALVIRNLDCGGLMAVR